MASLSKLYTGTEVRVTKQFTTPTGRVVKKERGTVGSPPAVDLGEEVGICVWVWFAKTRGAWVPYRLLKRVRPRG